ncbi:P83/100 family protein [Pseudoflavonifractor phocaeensis]|uniref:P83/100 family protein n=1 Tax=Pseudoflavonifractor phocaeensis TaxID=1870988 RepID=UPI00210ED1B0|nr:P83/100 family protein [Pseudoflavonifractor phocaeensis]MCQ4863112.1 hypothetical protein [Pseudoflavonifractor phocaeensis]
MAVTLEQVEKLREKSGASYEACKDALDRTGGDLLEAMIFLERTGRSRTAPRGGTFTTERGGGVDEAAKLVLETQSKAGKKGKKSGGVHDGDWREWLRELWAAGLNLLRHSTVNQFEVWRHDRLMTSIPILILILLVVVAFWISVPLLIIGLFAGCRYRFVGPDLGKESINDVMDNVSATVDDMVGQVKKEFHESKSAQEQKADRAEESARRARESVEKAQRSAEKAARKAQEAAEKATRKAQEAAEKAARKAQEVGRKARETAGQATQKAQDTAGKAARKAEDFSKKMDDMVDSICGHVDNLVSKIDDAFSDKDK